MKLLRRFVEFRSIFMAQHNEYQPSFQLQNMNVHCHHYTIFYPEKSLVKLVYSRKSGLDHLYPIMYGVGNGTVKFFIMRSHDISYRRYPNNNIILTKFSDNKIIKSE